jgi:ribosomal protein L16/L10AE
MGTGKGKVKEWLTEFKRGQLLLSFESCGGKRTTERVFRLLYHKLPIKVQIIRR